MRQETKKGDRIGRLLRLAGPRPAAPRDSEERVRNAVYDVWRESVRGRQRRRFVVRTGIALAAAASIVAVVGLLWQPTAIEQPVFSGTIARVEAVTGGVRLLEPGSGSPGRELGVGDLVPAGMILDTGLLGRAALRLESGSSLRLDQQTRLHGLTDSIVSLESGAIYFDSGPESAEAAATHQVEVRTRHGVVQDIGTQFEVRLREEATAPRMSVRVREGRIHLDRDGQSYDAGAGVELSVDERGDLSRRDVAIYGPEWDWILAVAPSFELEGKTLEAFLGWVTRETGLRLDFLEEPERLSAVLHGSIPGMRPYKALEAVLPTCELEHRLDSGILVIEAQGP